MEFHKASPKQCAFPKERAKKDTAIYWVAAECNGALVTLAEKRSGCKLSSHTLNCACGIEVMPVEAVGAYLEKALNNGKFKRLVLVGAQAAMQRVRRHLPETLLSLITTEIIEPDHEFLAHLQSPKCSPPAE